MLARNPASFLLIGDLGGWIRIKDIHKALMEEKLFPAMTPARIEQHLRLFAPEGFEISGKMVRALPGVQANGLFDYQPSSPPPMLFAAIRPKALRHVTSSGLFASEGGRRIVLFSSRKNALVFGKRFHPRPVICKIIASQAGQNGVTFFYAGSGVYLADKIDTQWLILPEVKEEPVENKTNVQKAPRGRPAAANDTGWQGHAAEAGSFIPTVAAFEELFKKDAGATGKRRSRKKPGNKYIGRKNKKKR